MKDEKTNQIPIRSEGITSNDSSNDSLEQRLAREVSAVENRIETMRKRATETVRQRNVRLETFVIAATQIDNLIQAKIKTLTSLNVLEAIALTEKLDSVGLPDGLFANKTITIAVPHSSDCPATAELTFNICHDSTIENAIVDYKLQIIPVFFKFENRNQITVPFKQSKGESITQWIDDRIVEFTKAFFQIRFHDQYQRIQMATDPVINIQFPKAFAFGTRPQPGTICHFYTKESMLEFECAALNLLTSFTGIDPNANHCI